MADDFDSRDRDGVRQRIFRLWSEQFEGSHPLHHREGGNRTLYVAEPKPGVYLSSWMLDVDGVRDFIATIQRDDNHFVLSLVIDTNVPGHPTVSMQLQEIFIIPE